MNRNIMQIDFSMFESTLEDFQTTMLLGLEGEEDLVKFTQSQMIVCWRTND
jgi:hypothetical protein